MIILLSPAKTVDFETATNISEYSTPEFIKEAAIIAKELKKLSFNELKKVLEVSQKLAELNFERYKVWQPEHDLQNAKQAILTFKGDVFTGLSAENLSIDDLQYAQDHLVILSALYGILRPLDLIRPFRIEMAAKFSLPGFKNLYEYWGETIKTHLKEKINDHENQTIINLASEEYYKAIKPKQIKTKIITPVFKELKGDKYKIVSIYAKRARGLMTSYIIKNRIADPENLKFFENEGYFYNDPLSDENNWVFTRY
jgi:cytoplasmic iron level regulating protein YaaA (DUF328/UPF0246 family)